MTQAQSTSQSLAVDWRKCQEHTWCQLNYVDLSHAWFNVDGVYVIWHGGTEPKTVYVGQGCPVRDRLAAHRKDAEIQKYKGYGLYVTWAQVAKAMLDGVEVYLATTFKPLVGKRYPVATPINVNGPWDKR